jgi:transposase
MRADYAEPKDSGEQSQAGPNARISSAWPFQSADCFGVRASAQVVGRVRKEYERQGLAVLKDRPRPGRPRSSRDKQSVRKVVETVCQAPAKGLSRWSARTLGRHLNIASATVNRILRENKLQASSVADLYL